MLRRRAVQFACAVAAAAGVTGVRAGQIISLVRNDTEPTWGVDDPPVGRFRDTHTTYDLILDVPGDWLGSDLFAQVIGGEGIIWNATDELDNLQYGFDLTWNGSTGVPMLPTGSGNSREFDTFLAPPVAPFLVNAYVGPPGGDPVVGPEYINGWGGGGGRYPVVWYDTVDSGPARFVAARLTFEHPPDRPLTLDAGAPGAVPFVTLRGTVAWQGDSSPAFADYEYTIYQVPEPAAGAIWLVAAAWLGRQLVGVRRAG